MGRISTGTITIGIFAVLFALVGAYALRAALVVEEKPPAPQVQTVTVPLAASDLPADRTIMPGDMVLVPMTRQEMLDRKYPLEQLMINTDQIIGRILKKPLKQGEAFLTTEMYPEGVLPDPADRLRPGLRAVTIPMDDVNSVGGTISVGSFVDVVFRSTARPLNPATKQQPIPEAVVTLIEGAEVIGITHASGGGGRDPRGALDVRQMNQAVNTNSIRSVTLAVTPEQANMLKAVVGRGEITLAARPDPAEGSSPSSPIMLEDLLGIKPEPEPFRTEIYRDLTGSVLLWDQNNRRINEFDGVNGYGGLGSVETESVRAAAGAGTMIEN